MILEFLREYKSATRKDIDSLIMNKLSDALTERQKQNKIKNLLQSMSKKEHLIENIGSRKKPEWKLSEEIS
jgi:ATP-dependent DNA helicase RecG